MTHEELQTVLDEHKKWLNSKGGRCAVLTHADLSHADLRVADLRVADLNYAALNHANLSRANLRGAALNHAVLNHANLSYANLRGADLTEAVLSGVNLDYSCWPLWCGSLDAHIDTRIAVQLLYHLMRPCLVSEGVDDDFKKALFTPELIAWANKFHRVKECGEIEWPKEG